MDKNDIKAYLVGYDGDERYRIWTGGEVMLSRDVIFREKFCDCKEYVKLPFRDSELKDEETQEERREDNTEQTSENENKDGSIYEDYETEDDTTLLEVKRQKEIERDRSSLSLGYTRFASPKRYLFLSQIYPPYLNISISFNTCVQ